MATDTQLCRDCRYIYHITSRVPCLSCDSTRLTIPCSPNLVGIVERLLDRGVEVVSASCNLHDAYIDGVKGKVCTGKSVQTQIELGYSYPIQMFEHLPPGWLTYEYHTVQEYNQIGPAFTGLVHLEQFTDDDELEFATMITIKNLESYLDDKDADAFRSVWRLTGVI